MPAKDVIVVSKKLTLKDLYLAADVLEKDKWIDKAQDFVNQAVLVDRAANQRHYAQSLVNLAERARKVLNKDQNYGKVVTVLGAGIHEIKDTMLEEAKRYDGKDNN